MKIMRKGVCGYGHLLLFLMLAILPLLVVIAVQATTTTMVSIPEITKPPDACATLPITIASVEKYGTGTISITYDPSVVHVTSVSDGPESKLTGWSADNTTGVVRISAWNIAGVSGDIVFAKIDFKVVGSAGLSTPLRLNVTTLKDTSYKDIPVSVTDGAFNIETEGDTTTSTSTSTSSSTTPTSVPTITPSIPSSPTGTPPTSTFTTPTFIPTPTETGEAKATPTLTPTSRPKEKIPGFETLFACTALLIAYMVLFRKRIRKERK